MAIALLIISRKLRREGVLMSLGFTNLCGCQFGLEAIRSDEPGQFGTNLTISQWVSIFVFIASLSLIIYLIKAGGTTGTIDQQSIVISQHEYAKDSA
ncbi:MAG: hypothetical protein R3C05_09530 [Pirellulaceae bacterium]